MLLGLRDLDIAARLGKSERTAKRYVGGVLEKAGIQNRASLWAVLYHDGRNELPERSRAAATQEASTTRDEEASPTPEDKASPEDTAANEHPSASTSVVAAVCSPMHTPGPRTVAPASFAEF